MAPRKTLNLAFLTNFWPKSGFSLNNFCTSTESWDEVVNNKQRNRSKVKKLDKCHETSIMADRLTQLQDAVNHVSLFLQGVPSRFNENIKFARNYNFEIFCQKIRQIEARFALFS